MLYKKYLFKLFVLLILPSLLEADIGIPAPLWLFNKFLKWIEKQKNSKPNPPERPKLIEPPKPLILEDVSKVNFGVGLMFDGDTPISICQRMKKWKSFIPCTFPINELRNKGYLLEDQYRYARKETRFIDGFPQYANDPKYVFCQRKGVLLEVKPLSERLEEKLRRGYNAALLPPSEINNFIKKASYRETFNPLLEDIDNKAMKLKGLINDALFTSLNISLESDRVKYKSRMTEIKLSIRNLTQSIIAFQSNPEVIASGQAYAMTKIRVKLPNNPKQSSSMVTHTEGSESTSEFEKDLEKLCNVASECESVKENGVFDTITTLACTPLER